MYVFENFTEILIMNTYSRVKFISDKLAEIKIHIDDNDKSIKIFYLIFFILLNEIKLEYRICHFQ